MHPPVVLAHILALLALAIAAVAGSERVSGFAALGFICLLAVDLVFIADIYL